MHHYHAPCLPLQATPTGGYDAATSLRYRDLVLRPGGALPAASLLFSFLGEAPSLDALHRWLSGEE